MEATLDPKQLQRFRDPVWRISNLYAIRTRDGKVVPFRPRPQQLEVLHMLYSQGLKRIVILKARQLSDVMAQTTPSLLFMSFQKGSVSIRSNSNRGLEPPGTGGP